MSLSPDIIQAIQTAVQAALAANSTSTATILSTPSTTVMANAPAISSSPSFTAPIASTSHLGRSAPSFLSTFSLPSTFSPVSLSTSLPSTASPLGSVIPLSSQSILSPLSPTLHEPFVVGPGHSPVPSKLVTQIVCGKYVDLSDLLPANLTPLPESEPQLFMDGRLVLTSKPKKNRATINDITSWTEAFTIYSLVLAHYFPKRWEDLNRYKLIILRTYRTIGGQAWLLYDQRFREHAAATKLSNWSEIDVQLYNFHSASAKPRESRPQRFACLGTRGVASPLTHLAGLHTNAPGVAAPIAGATAMVTSATKTDLRSIPFVQSTQGQTTTRHSPSTPPCGSSFSCSMVTLTLS